MFSLVQYDNLEYTILSSKRVKVIQGSNCVVKYSTGANYNAELIEISDSKVYLEELQRKFENPEPQIKTSTPNTSLELPYVRLSDISALNLTYSVHSSSSAPSGFTDIVRELDSNWPDEDSVNTTQNMSIDNPLINDDSESEKDLVIDVDYTSEKNSVNNEENMSNVSEDDTNNVSEACFVIDDKDAHEENAENNIDENAPLINGLKIIGDIILANNLGSNVMSITTSGKFNLEHLDDLCTNEESPNDYDMEQRNENIDQINEQDLNSINRKNGKKNDNSTLTENESVIKKDSKNDSSYNPEELTKNSTNETSSTVENSSIQENSSILDEGPPLNIQELKVPTVKPKSSKSRKSRKSKVESKVHFCPFCKTLQTKFARHLIRQHKTEKDVKEFTVFPGKHLERKAKINFIRTTGDFMHNTKPEFNTGILIVSRQKQKKSKNVAEDYVCCKSCKGFFAKRSIRFHTARCDKRRNKGEKNILSSSRSLTGYIHQVANENLRRIVFPVLTDDDIVRAIKYDELIILFGNKLCDRYTLRHQHDYVRTQLRMLGRVKLEMMKLEKDIHEFKDIFKPQYFNKCIEALRILAEWNGISGIFKVPFNAQFISTLMKKCAKKLRTECIKCQDHDRRKNVEDSLLLWEEEIPTLITKKAHNDQMDKRRGKKVVLPSKEDIKLLYDYLRNECYNCIEILDAEFDSNAYKLLIKCTLILVQIFNRRRAGEIEQLKIINYQNKEILNDNIDKELYQKLSDGTKECAKQFTRLVIRGKQEKTVPVLLNPLAEKSIVMILKYRKQAGVPDKNEYLFCSFSRGKLAKPYMRACPLLNRFTNECGAVMPKTLRGTQLRKHIATYTSMLYVEEYQVERLAKFMGHHKDIHKSIYRVPVPVAEITDVSKLLMAAIGKDEENDDDDRGSDDDQNSDSDSEEENDNSQEQAADAVSNNAVSSSDEENTSFKPQNKLKTVRCHKLPSTKKIKRTKWSDREKKAITKHFGDLVKLEKLPSLKECRRVIEKFEVLKNRTPQHVFSYINNQRRRN